MVKWKNKSSCTVFGPHNGSYTNSVVYMSRTKWNLCFVITADRYVSPIASRMYMWDHKVM